MLSDFFLKIVGGPHPYPTFLIFFRIPTRTTPYRYLYFRVGYHFHFFFQSLGNTENLFGKQLSRKSYLVIDF